MTPLDELRALAERAMKGNEHHTDGCELCVLCRGLLALIPVVEAAIEQERLAGTIGFVEAIVETGKAVADFTATHREGETKAT